MLQLKFECLLFNGTAFPDPCSAGTIIVWRRKSGQLGLVLPEEHVDVFSSVIMFFISVTMG